MCEIKKVFKGKKQVVGYKVVLVHEGRMYSISNGIEYAVGKVQVPDENASAPCGWCDNSHMPRNRFYIPQYKGLTAVVSLADAQHILLKFSEIIGNYQTSVLNGKSIPTKLAIAKIRLGGVKYVGTHWDNQKTHLGSIIREIELIN